MKKKQKFLKLFLGAAFIWSTATLSAQVPVIYPGAVQQMEQSNYYLSKDGFGRVFDFYANSYGKPETEGVNDEGKRSAFFVSDKNWKEQQSWKLDPPGVRITELQGDSKAVSRVFWALDGLIKRGFLTKERYDEIESQYIGLKDHYFKRGEDQEIQKRYEQKLLEGGDPVAIQEQVMARVQELIMSGNFQEATAMAEKMKEEIMGNLEMANSEQAVDEWIKCLEEIKAISYPVMITISQ